MYDPLALDLQRIDQERIRHSADEASRHLRIPAPRHHDEPATGRAHRRVSLASFRLRTPAQPCTDC